MMIVQLLAVTALLLGFGRPIEEVRLQDEDAAWTALHEVVPHHIHAQRSRVRITETPDMAALVKRLEELLPQVAGTTAEPIARFYLGNALFKVGRLEEAAATFEAIGKGFPDHGLNKKLAAEEPSMIEDAIADCRGEIELRKVYEIVDLPHAELDRQARAVFHTTDGSFEIQLHATASPETCANFRKLVEEGYYVGLCFHEIQSYRKLMLGCPNTRDEMKDRPTWGLGGPAWDLPFELNDAMNGPGAVSMRRSASGRSHGSQFTICLSDQPDLNNKQVVFGRVVRGLDVLRRLSQNRVDAVGRPEDRIAITGTEWKAGPPGR